MFVGVLDISIYPLELSIDFLTCGYKLDVSLDSVFIQWLVDYGAISFCTLRFWPSFCSIIIYLHIFKRSGQAIAEDELNSERMNTIDQELKYHK